jgi:hypothetical protein
VCGLGFRVPHALVRPGRPGMLALSGSTCKAIPWSSLLPWGGHKGPPAEEFQNGHSCEKVKKLRHWLGPGDKPQTFPLQVLPISCPTTLFMTLPWALGSLGSLGACLGTSV